MIMNWLRNRKTQSILVFGPLVGLVWAAGPSLGLASVAARLGWLLLFLVLWAGFLLVAPIRKLRSAAVMPAPPGDPAPGPAFTVPRDPAGVTELRRRMRRALDSLKASHLGSTRGRRPLWPALVSGPRRRRMRQDQRHPQRRAQDHPVRPG